MEEKPILGHVALHNCIKVYKECKVLMGLGYPVHLLTQQINYGHHEYCTVGHYANVRQLHSSIRALPQVKIWHVHNEPDWIAEEVLKAKYEYQKVVWDIHDFESARWQSTPVEEQRIMRTVDGVVHISKPMSDYAHEIYGDRHPPTAILGCHVPKEWYAEPAGEDEFIGDCVYEGGLDTPFKYDHPVDQKSSNQNPGISFRDYGLLFQSLVQAGKSVTAYKSNVGADTSGYASFGVWVRDCLPYPQLIPTIRHYRWGIIGSSYASVLMDYAMPNKLFEYLASGIPVIVYEANTAAEFVERHGIGIVIRSKTRQHPSFSEQLRIESPNIIEQARLLMTPEKWRECRANVLAKRELWSMDSQIKVITELYNFILQKPKGGNGECPDHKESPTDTSNAASPGAFLKWEGVDAELVTAAGLTDTRMNMVKIPTVIP